MYYFKNQVNKKAINDDLENHWEILAEPIQMIMRKYGLENPYEFLKEKTRGQKVSKNILDHKRNNLKFNFRMQITRK